MRCRSGILAPSWSTLALTATAFMFTTGGAPAQSTPEAKMSPDATPPPSVYDRIWRHAKLYSDTEGAVIQSLEFTGRFHADYAVLDHGDFQEFDIRRFRLGGKVKFFHDFTVHSEVDLALKRGPVYSRLTDAYVAWSPNRNFTLTAGKQPAPFTMDGSTSSKELLAIDRSNLANNLWFPQEYIPGLSLGGEPGHWRYRLGVYSSGSADREFGKFDGKYFVLTTLGYDFAESFGARAATLAADYVYNEPDARNTFTRSLNHIGSLHFKFETGKWGFRTDLTGGIGYLGQSDLWGAMLLPHYQLTPRLQLVARYTFLQSAGNNGVRFAHYEDQIITGRGDEYQEFYAGVNYYFYGHKLKLQTGVQHVEMRDHANDGGQFSGWAWTTGLRVSW